MTKEDLIADLRRRRDWAAAHGNHAEALMMNDRILDLKEGRTSAVVERTMKLFESALARRKSSRIH